MVITRGWLTRPVMQPWIWPHYEICLTFGVVSPKLGSRLQRNLLDSDGRSPDDVTLISWESGKCFAWDVTVINTLAEPYRIRSAEAADAAAVIACSSYKSI